MSSTWKIAANDSNKKTIAYMPIMPMTGCSRRSAGCRSATKNTAPSLRHNWKKRDAWGHMERGRCVSGERTKLAAALHNCGTAVAPLQRTCGEVKTKTLLSKEPGRKSSILQIACMEKRQ